MPAYAEVAEHLNIDPNNFRGGRLGVFGRINSIDPVNELLLKAWQVRT